jgi:hypothetical protein
MQTFLPVASYEETAKLLDRQRLGKQRVECKQILRAMYTKSSWSKHPAVTMWRGCAYGLVIYYDAICAEWIRRGYKHNMSLDSDLRARALTEDSVPSWLGDEMFHYSHRCSLLYKDPKHYGPLFNTGPLGLDLHAFPQYNYVWPKHTPIACLIAATFDIW